MYMYMYTIVNWSCNNVYGVHYAQFEHCIPGDFRSYCQPKKTFHPGKFCIHVHVCTMYMYSTCVLQLSQYFCNAKCVCDRNIPRIRGIVQCSHVYPAVLVYYSIGYHRGPGQDSATQGWSQLHHPSSSSTCYCEVSQTDVRRVLCSVVVWCYIVFHCLHHSVNNRRQCTWWLCECVSTCSTEWAVMCS